MVIWNIFIKWWNYNKMINQNYTLKDSGKRKKYLAGAVRDLATGKGRFDLIPPEVMKAYAIHLEKGARKYADRNWEKGIPLSRFLDSAQRHLNQYLMGDVDENHLYAWLWNVCGFVTTKERIDNGTLPKGLDDLPKKNKKR